MAIATRCPHCSKTYSLKNELAGKRVTCNNPNCKKTFTVDQPAAAATGGSNGAPPRSKPSVSVEEMALAALADEPKAEAASEEKAEGAPIRVKCQFCDHENVYEARLAGKNAPCQNDECRKIIKVPLPKKDDPKDWRTVTRRPSAAKVDSQQLEGAWGNIEATAVGREAIIAAQANRVEEREPRTWGQLISIGLAMLAVLVVLVGGGLWGLRRFSEGKQQRSMEAALAYTEVDPKSKTPAKLKKDQAGLIHLLAGQYETKKNRLEEARKHLVEARSGIDQAGNNSAENSAALIDLAVALAELAGTKEQVEQGTRLDLQKNLQSDLRITLQRLGTPGDEGREMRAHALRRLTQVLAPVGHAAAVIALANTFAPADERGDLLGVIGLELIALGQHDEAFKLASQASVMPGNNPTSLVALWLALASADNIPDDKKKLAQASLQKIAPPPGMETVTPLVRIGYASGWAQQGRVDEARKLAWSSGKPDEQLRAATAVAAAVARTRPEDTAILEECATLLDTELKNQPVSAWLLYRLTLLALQAQKVDLASRFVTRIPDAGLQSWAKLDVLQAKLKAMGQQPAGLELVKEVGEESRLAHALAYTAIARHNTAAGATPDVGTWETDLQKAFGHAGVALAER